MRSALRRDQRSLPEPDRVDLQRSETVEARVREAPTPSRRFFDEMRAPDGKVRPAYADFAGLLDGLSIESARHQADRGGGAVSPPRHHLRRLCRRRLDRAADPVRPHSAHPRPRRMGACRARLHSAGEGDQRLPLRHLSRPGDHQGRPRAAGLRASQLSLPARDARHRAAEPGLCPYRRHRSHPHRRARLFRARGQCAHALRRLLCAREPRDHDAAVS